MRLREPPEGWAPPNDWPKVPEGGNFRAPVENTATGMARALIDKARSATGQSHIVGGVGADTADLLWEGTPRK